MVIANAIGSLTLLGLLLMGGFVLAKGNIKHWTVWLFWMCAPPELSARASLADTRLISLATFHTPHSS